MENKFINVDEISSFLGISRSAVYGYVHRKKIPFIKLEGKLLFDEQDIAKWIEGKKQGIVEDTVS